MSERLPRACERRRERLPEYAEGRLVGAALADVQRHLAACARCAAELADLRAVIAAARAVPQEDPPEHLVARVTRAVHAQAPAAPRQFWLRLAVPAAVLTGLVAVTFAIRAPYPRAGRQAAPLAKPEAVLERPAADEVLALDTQASESDSLTSATRGARGRRTSAREGESHPGGPLAAGQTHMKAEGMQAPPQSGGRAGGAAVVPSEARGERRSEAPPMDRREYAFRGHAAEAKGKDAQGGLRENEEAAAEADQASEGPVQPTAAPAAEQRMEDLAFSAGAGAKAAVAAPPPVSAAITVVKEGSGGNLLALRLSEAQPVRELSLQIGAAEPTHLEWRGAPGSPVLIPLPQKVIGSGPAAVPVTVAAEQGRQQYVLFVPTLARLGESAPQAPVGRWKAVTVDQALLDLSTFTGLVILAEQPLGGQLCGDIPAGTPEEALRRLAAEAGFDVQRDGPIAYTLTHAR